MSDDKLTKIENLLIKINNDSNGKLTEIENFVLQNYNIEKLLPNIRRLNTFINEYKRIRNDYIQTYPAAYINADADTLDGIIKIYIYNLDSIEELLRDDAGSFETLEELFLATDNHMCNIWARQALVNLYLKENK